MKLNPFNIIAIVCLIVIGLPFIAAIAIIFLPFLLLLILFGSPVTHRQGTFRWQPRYGRKTEREVNEPLSEEKSSDGDVCDVECKVLKTETLDDDAQSR